MKEELVMILPMSLLLVLGTHKRQVCQTVTRSNLGSLVTASSSQNSCQAAPVAIQKFLETKYCLMKFSEKN